MPLRDDDFRKLLQTHPTPHFAVAADGTVTWCNDAAKRLLGVTDAGRIGESWTALLRPSERERAGALPEAGRWTFVDRGGAPVDVRVSLVGPGGTEDEGLLLALEDMRAEEDIRRALARRESAIREVSDAIPGAIFEYIVFPDGTDRVTYISSGCFDLWELEAEDVERDASALWAQVHPDDLPGMQESVMKSAAEGSQWIHQWRITTPSGRNKWLQGNGQPTRLGDGSVRWNTCILDVTPRVLAQLGRDQLDAQLRQAQQLEALGRVAGGVAHDFNNVLTVILGLGEAALDQVDEGTPLHADLTELLNAAHRSVDLTSQLLAFSRNRSGAVEKVHLCRRVADTRRLLARLVPANIELEYDVGERCTDQTWVALEPGNVDQIVANLVLNARDAMPEGGCILVRALEAESEDGRPGVALFVKDEGVGMDEQTRVRVFDPFFSTKGEHGTGLGLSTVARVVEAAGGTIRVESAPGEGTTIGVWLPACPPPDETGDGTLESDESGAASGPRVILVVEDEPQVRTFVERALAKAGYTVHAAADANEALAIVERVGDELDAVLSDTVLPGPSGLDVVAEIRRAFPDIPALLMTGYVTDEGLWGRIEASGVPVLRKPFRLTELLERVAEVIEDRATG
jgi:signal transduction histidine kinase